MLKQDWSTISVSVSCVLSTAAAATADCWWAWINSQTDHPCITTPPCTCSFHTTTSLPHISPSALPCELSRQRKIHFTASATQCNLNPISRKWIEMSTNSQNKSIQTVLSCPVNLSLSQPDDMMFTDYSTIPSRRKRMLKRYVWIRHVPLSLLCVYTTMQTSLSTFPRPSKGGPLPETPSNKYSRLLLAALSLGFSVSECWLLSASFSLVPSLQAFLKNETRTNKQLSALSYPSE